MARLDGRQNTFRGCATVLFYLCGAAVAVGIAAFMVGAGFTQDSGNTEPAANGFRILWILIAAAAPVLCLAIFCTGMAEIVDLLHDIAKTPRATPLDSVRFDDLPVKQPAKNDAPDFSELP